MPHPLIISLILLLLTHKIYSEDREYILNSPKCKIPNINPFSEEIKALMENSGYVTCNNNTELLTYVTTSKNGSATLHLREDLIPRYSSKEIDCCYSYVHRSGTEALPDEGISFTPCIHLHTEVPLKHDNVKVTCGEHDPNLDTFKVVYENVHHPIVIKEPIKKKLKTYHSISKPISVLFVVVDSISRLNLIRTMQRSYDFMQKNNFIEMKGYTKVADNTFPNAMALLTGFNLGRSMQFCTPTVVDALDLCPMIWYDYSKKGYITAYAEDHASIATFNYRKKGFTEPPTDYYFKPYLEASETLKIGWRYDMPYCTGPETSGERILNLAKDFAVTFRNQSTFGVFWMNTFSHNDVSASYSMDEKMSQFLEEIKKEGVLDESIVFFLSDHGVRYGKILGTQSGWFEERMPANIISIPKSFQERFTNEYLNLKENANKLTSTYDLFMTLQHILKLYGVPHQVRQSQACPECVSLFQTIPTDRSCANAGIPSQWCTCLGHFQTIDENHDLVTNTTTISLSKIKAQIDRVQCQDYYLNRVLSASISQSIRADKKTKYLFVVFSTVPSTIFLVTVKFRLSVTENSTFFIKRFNNRDFCIRHSDFYK